MSADPAPIRQGPESFEAIWEYVLLDPEPEPAFDDLARLAAQSCGVAAGFISVAGRSGLWLKSKGALSSAEQEHALALANLTLTSKNFTCIPDLQRDERFAGWSQSAARPLRFYAGVPLVASEGYAIGTLSVLDYEPRPFAAEQQAWLKAVAGQVLSQLELRRSLVELSQVIGERHRAEQALASSEERYRELFENANDIVYTHDLDERFTSLNRAGERITGYTREEVLEMGFSDVVAPEHVPLAREMMARKIAGEPTRTYTLEILAKDGRRVPLELSTRVILEKGRPVAIQGIARDITDRRRAEAALQDAHEKLTGWVRELEERSRETLLLSEMGNLLQSCMTSDEAHVAIAKSCGELFPQASGALLMLNDARDMVETVAAWNEPLAGERVFMPEECWALRRGRAHAVADPEVGPVCHHLGSNRAVGSLCVPMMAQGAALGVLHIQWPVTPAESEAGAAELPIESMQRLAGTVAEHIALSLANVRLRETLRNQSIRDPLTGLFNRRYLEASMARELQRAARKQRPLGVIMLDVDHFKKFNDTYGHAVGDVLLRELGALLRSTTRGDDIACRYGGEEFTLILPEATLEITRKRAEELRAKVRQLNFQHRDSDGRAVTLSLGVAAFPEHGTAANELLHAADQALYRAKAEGRDRVVLAESAGTPTATA